MKNFFSIIAIAIILLIILAIVAIGMIYGLQALMAVVPCELLVFTVTGLLLVAVAIIALLLFKLQSDGKV